MRPRTMTIAHSSAMAPPKVHTPYVSTGPPDVELERGAHCANGRLACQSDRAHDAPRDGCNRPVKAPYSSIYSAGAPRSARRVDILRFPATFKRAASARL